MENCAERACLRTTRQGKATAAESDSLLVSQRGRPRKCSNLQNYKWPQIYSTSWKSSSVLNNVTAPLAVCCFCCLVVAMSFSCCGCHTCQYLQWQIKFEFDYMNLNSRSLKLQLAHQDISWYLHRVSWWSQRYHNIRLSSVCPNLLFYAACEI